MKPVDRRASIHEAGHALIARLLGLRVLAIRIRPRPETQVERRRRLPQGKPRSPAERALLEGELMVALGGLAAERTLSVSDGQSLQAAHEDLAKASELALRLSGRSRAEPTIAHFLSVTERMLRARVEILERTAEELAEEGSLDEQRLQALIPRG